MIKLIEEQFLNENVNELLSHNERLCYVTQSMVNVDNKCINCDSHGLVLFFTTLITK